MMPIDPKYNLRPRPQVRSMRDEDGAVLLDLKGGKYFSLNGIGAEIWKQVEHGADLETLTSALLESYQVEPEVLARDLQSFLTTLEDNGLITREAAASPETR